MSSKRLKDIVKHQHKWYGKWHTIAGLSAGFVLIIVSLTGALLVFEQELDVWLNPDLFTFEEKGKLLSLQEVREKVEYDHPTWEVERLFIQDQKNNAILLFAEETGKPHRHPHPQIIVNPYTGEVMGSRIYKYSLMGVIRNLHRTLLIPFIGRYLVGLSSLFCVILMITGLRQWIPKKRKQLKNSLIQLKHL